ncbi:MAG: hypothetical protein M0T72_00735 [Candidatus Dormibacteraeota bacterium]|nr:hypothetical protein [Candidatus Dormibacteraeota bacterium]
MFEYFLQSGQLTDGALLFEGLSQRGLSCIDLTKDGPIVEQRRTEAGWVSRFADEVIAAALCVNVG